MTQKALISAAKRDGVPIASKAADLIRIALELEEDLAFGQLVEQRIKEGPIKLLSHKQVWAGFL